MCEAKEQTNLWRPVQHYKNCWTKDQPNKPVEPLVSDFNFFLFLLQTKWKISFYQAKKPKATIFQLSLCFRSRGSEWWGWQQQQWQQQARAKQLLKWIQGQTHFSTGSYWFSLQPMLKCSFFIQPWFTS